MTASQFAPALSALAMIAAAALTYVSARHKSALDGAAGERAQLSKDQADLLDRLEREIARLGSENRDLRERLGRVEVEHADLRRHLLAGEAANTELRRELLAKERRIGELESEVVVLKRRLAELTHTARHDGAGGDR